MDNKQEYEDWLTKFKQNINGKKFTAVKAYLKYMAAIERHLKMQPDSIYAINRPSDLVKLETKLRKVPSFSILADKTRANLLSALHVYQNRMEILEKSKSKNKNYGR